MRPRRNKMPVTLLLADPLMDYGFARRLQSAASPLPIRL